MFLRASSSGVLENPRLVYPSSFIPEDKWSHLWPPLHPHVFGGVLPVLRFFAFLAGLHKVFIAVTHTSLCLPPWKTRAGLILL